MRCCVIKQAFCKFAVVLRFEAVNAFSSHWRITKPSSPEPEPRGRHPRDPCVLITGLGMGSPRASCLCCPGAPGFRGAAAQVHGTRALSRVSTKCQDGSEQGD